MKNKEKAKGIKSGGLFMKMNENENQNKPSSEELVNNIDENLRILHNSLITTSMDVGYASAVINANKPYIIEVLKLSLGNPYLEQLQNSLLYSLKAYNDELELRIEDSLKPLELIGGTAGSAITLVNAVSSTDGVVGGETNFKPVEVPVLSNEERTPKIINRLNDISKPLADTYKEIWEVLYGTHADPKRGALFLIRQSFDQLFRQLAPDDKVRESEFWVEKEGDTPNKIYRKERLVYAANFHIKDSFRRETLLESTSHMLNVYGILNSAHDDNAIDHEKARVALIEMSSILEDWALSINL